MTSPMYKSIFFFNDTATTEIYTLSLHDALPISPPPSSRSAELPAWCWTRSNRPARRSCARRARPATWPWRATCSSATSSRHTSDGPRLRPPGHRRLAGPAGRRRAQHRLLDTSEVGPGRGLLRRRGGRNRVGRDHLRPPRGAEAHPYRLAGQPAGQQDEHLHGRSRVPVRVQRGDEPGRAGRPRRHPRRSGRPAGGRQAARHRAFDREPDAGRAAVSGGRGRGADGRGHPRDLGPAQADADPDRDLEPGPLRRGRVHRRRDRVIAALLASWWTAIWPNLAANVIWMTPAFVVHHVLLRRHVTRRTRQHREEPHAEG